MKQPPGQPGRGNDDLAGSPELFVTNLLIVRGIEEKLSSIEIKREPERIVVQLYSHTEEYEQEVLTEDVSRWKTIRERFESMTKKSDTPSDADTLEARTPKMEQVEEIQIEHLDDDTLRLDLVYPD